MLSPTFYANERRVRLHIVHRNARARNGADVWIKVMSK